MFALLSKGRRWLRFRERPSRSRAAARPQSVASIAVVAQVSSGDEVVRMCHVNALEKSLPWRLRLLSLPLRLCLPLRYVRLLGPHPSFSELRDSSGCPCFFFFLVLSQPVMASRGNPTTISRRARRSSPRSSPTCSSGNRTRDPNGYRRCASAVSFRLFHVHQSSLFGCFMSL